jgi:hypothetical protein
MLAPMSLIYASAMRAFRQSERFGASAPSAFTILMGPGLPRHPGDLLDQHCLRKLREYPAFSDPSMKVYLHPRSHANRVLGKPKPPYAFRAFTRDGVSHIFIDGTETPQSLCWLIGHELTHQVIDKSPTVKAAMADASSRPTGLDPAGDEFHNVDAEERFCDGVATNLVGKRLDRAWWRERVRRFGQKV